MKLLNTIKAKTKTPPVLYENGRSFTIYKKINSLDVVHISSIQNSKYIIFSFIKMHKTGCNFTFLSVLIETFSKILV